MKKFGSLGLVLVLSLVLVAAPAFAGGRHGGRQHGGSGFGPMIAAGAIGGLVAGAIVAPHLAYAPYHPSYPTTYYPPTSYADIRQSANDAGFRAGYAGDSWGCSAYAPDFSLYSACYAGWQRGAATHAYRQRLRGW